MTPEEFEEHRRRGFTDYFATPPDRRLVIEITCPRCGSDLILITKGRRYQWQSAAVMGCGHCMWQGVVDVTITSTRTDLRGAKFRATDQYANRKDQISA